MIVRNLVVEALPPGPDGARPGAIAASDDGLAFGLRSGGVLLSDGSLKVHDGRCVPDLFPGACLAVQAGGTGLVLLGEDHPAADGGARTSLLFLPTSDTDTHIPPFRIPLGPGAFALVGGSRSDSVVVYDRDPDTAAGARAIRASTGELLWEGPAESFTKMRWAGPRILGLTADGTLVERSGRGGALLGRHPLPTPTGVRWQTWTGTLADLVLAGRRSDGFVVGPAGDALVALPEAELPGDVALDAVADVEDLGDGRYLLVLGTDTPMDGVGTCVAALGGHDGWEVTPVHGTSACSAVLDWDGGRLLQCGDDLRVVRWG